MGFTTAAAEGNKSAKKRWRIGRRNKSKSSKDKDESKPEENENEDDEGTSPVTPESSDGSDSVSDDNNRNNRKVGVELPSPMSDVDDNSDDDDDDVYLDNYNDEVDNSNSNSNSNSLVLDDIAKLPKPPPNYGYSNNDNDNNDPDDDDLDDGDQDDDDHDDDDDVRRTSSKRLSMIQEGYFDDDEDEDGINYDDYDNDNVNDNDKVNDNDNDGYDNGKYNNANSSSNALAEAPPVPPKKKPVDHHIAPTRTATTTPTTKATPTPTKQRQQLSSPQEQEQVVVKKLFTNSKGKTMDDLPSSKELSKELCKVVATEHYSGDESLRALEKLSEWAHTQDSTLLKHFLTYGGVVKVIDFLKEQIEDNCKGDSFLMECIHKSADVICNVCFVGKHGINEDIAVVNATVVVKYDGIQTLLLASDKYCNSSNNSNSNGNGINILALKAAEGVWNAIMNVFCNAEAAINKKLSMLVLDAGIDMMAKIGSIDHPIASETLANVFNTFYRITYHDYITKEEFEQKDILIHCLNVFKLKRDDLSGSDGDEELLEEAISFFYGCHEKVLFSKASDYKRILPLCVMGLREFAQDNANIREWATKLLDGACSNINNKETIMMAEGAIEALAPFLTSKDVDAKEKDELRKLIRKIVAA